MKELEFFRTKGYYRYPKLMQIEVTTACPLRCPQCFIDDFNVKYMDREAYVKLIDEAKLLDVRAVVLFGGEPLLHEQITEFILYALHKDISVYIYTSGWNIEKILPVMREHPKKLNILLSLNGSTKEIHERSRDNYELTMSAMKKLQSEQLVYGINWVSRHDNIDDFEKLIAVAKMYSASYVNIVGNKIGASYQVVEPLDQLDYKKLLRIYMENSDFLSIENCNALLQNLTGRVNVFSGCTAGILNCSVTVNGEFVPCLRLIYPEKFASIQDYWMNSEVLNKLRDNANVQNHCSGCEFEKKCKYCKALSKTSYFDFNAGIPNCAIRGFNNE